jgi:serine/threonine protein phosphatase PrpC
MKFSNYQESRRGTRPNNEDRIGHSCGRDALLMVVADGMEGTATARLHPISTLSLGPTTFNTNGEEFSKAGTRCTDLSEAESEWAIAGILNVIRRHAEK